MLSNKTLLQIKIELMPEDCLRGMLSNKTLLQVDLVELINNV